MSDARDELMTPDRAFQVAWIVYINGLEVPCASVSVSYGVWQTPQAEIVMVPDPVLQRFGAEDRVSVQVFYCDYWMDPENPEFRLMFDGEIVSWSYVNVSTGRSMSFTCVDYIHIWDQLFFFFMTSLESMGVSASGETIGVNATSILNAAFAPIYPYSLFAYGLIPRTTGGDDSGEGAGAQLIQRPIDFVYNVVRGLIDSSLPNRTAIGSNFFSPWTQRTNFHKRFAAMPLLEYSTNPGIFPILRAVQAGEAVQAVANMATRTGNAGSVWQMLREVLDPLMMEIGMLPTAPAFKSDYNTLYINGPAPAESTASAPIFLANYFTKPPFFFGLPPTCNVFFPSQIQHFGYQEDYLTQPTRMYFNDETLPTLLERNATSTGALNQIMRDAISVAHPLEVSLAARAALNSEGITGKDILVYPEEFFKGPVIDRRVFPPWFTYIASATVQDAPEPNDTPTVNSVPVVTAPTPAAGSATAPTPASSDPRVIEDSAVGATASPSSDADPSTPVATPAAYTPPTPPAASATPSSEPGVSAPSTPATSPAPDAAAAPAVGSSSASTPDYNSVESSPEDISLAERCGIPVLMLEALRAVESGGAPNSLNFNRRTFVNNSGGVDIPADLYSGRGRAAELAQFQAAFRLNPEAAVIATAWGTYQVLGYPSFRREVTAELGTAAPQAFLNAFNANPEHISTLLSIGWWQSNGRARAAANAFNITEVVRRYLGTATASGDFGDGPGYISKVTRFIDARRSGSSVAEAAAAIGRPMRGARGRRRGAATATAAARPENVVLEPINVPVGSSSIDDAEEVTTNLLRYYAQYEFYKERYSRRSGAVTLAFNPYPVPGFPCAVFDRRSTQVDVFGYVTNVNQVLQSNNWETRVSVSQGRTFQEMFSLLRQQFIFENAQIQNALNTNDLTALNRSNILGSLSMAPPEPLVEIRDIIQTFVRAQTFYRSLFFCAPVISTNPTPAETATPSSASATTPGATVTPSTSSDVSGSDPEVLRKLAYAEKATVFYYPVIIEQYDPVSEVRTPISISGIDGTTRNQALQVIERLRNNDRANFEADLAFVVRVFATNAERAAEVQRDTLAYLRSTLTETPPNYTVLDNVKLTIQALTVDFSVRADLDIVPTQEAIPLFESYEQAMRYNARPICTLDEYVAFLGDRGVKIAPVEPNSEADGGRLFPATYYVQIKQYRDGPPEVVPTVNITNTSFVTAPSGTDAVSTGTAAPAVQGLPADFPETRSNWTDVLLTYRQRVLAELPPRS